VTVEKSVWDVIWDDSEWVSHRTVFTGTSDEDIRNRYGRRSVVGLAGIERFATEAEALRRLAELIQEGIAEQMSRLVLIGERMGKIS
jgi:predicted DNA-binding WGR domain protein